LLAKSGKQLTYVCQDANKRVSYIQIEKSDRFTSGNDRIQNTL